MHHVCQEPATGTPPRLPATGHSSTPSAPATPADPSAGLDWDEALCGLDVEIEVTRSAADRHRLLSIRELFMRWRGEDTAEIVAEITGLADAVSDPDADAWVPYYEGVTALLEGRADEAVTAMRRTLTYAAPEHT